MEGAFSFLLVAPNLLQQLVHDLGGSLHGPSVSGVFAAASTSEAALNPDVHGIPAMIGICKHEPSFVSSGSLFPEVDSRS